MSRSPIREALVMLSQEGLIDLLPRRGAYVTDLSPDDVAEHFGLLGEVAGRAAARAAEVLDDAARQHLARLHHRCAELGAKRETVVALDDEFNAVLYAVGSRRTQWLLGLLSQTLPIDAGDLGRGWDESTARSRERMLAAIASRDADGARDAIRRRWEEIGAAVASQLSTGRHDRRRDPEPNQNDTRGYR